MKICTLQQHKFFQLYWHCIKNNVT